MALSSRREGAIPLIDHSNLLCFIRLTSDALSAEHPDSAPSRTPFCDFRPLLCRRPVRVMAATAWESALSGECRGPVTGPLGHPHADACAGRGLDNRRRSPSMPSHALHAVAASVPAQGCGDAGGARGLSPATLNPRRRRAWRGVVRCNARTREVDGKMVSATWDGTPRHANRLGTRCETRTPPWTPSAI